MRSIIFPLVAATLFAVSSAHASDTPTQAQIQAAVDTGLKSAAAKSSSSSSMPVDIRVFSLVGCKPSAEVKEEVICLVGMSTGRRDAYTVVPLRKDGDTWVGVERKGAIFPAPTPAEAQEAIRSWAEQLVATDPEAGKDRQVEEARTTLKVKAVENCDVERKTGYLKCDMVLSVPDKQNVSTALKFALEGDSWTFVSR